MGWPTHTALDTVELTHIGDLEPVEVLYEFEGPCIFTARLSSRLLVLCYLCEDLEDEGLLRFIVSTTSPETIASLKGGLVSVRESLQRGTMLLVDTDYANRPKRAFAVEVGQLPPDALPVDGTMLWPHLEPEFVVKLDGPEIQPGSIPAAVLAQAGDIASKALKPAFEWAARSLRGEASDTDTAGRPPEWLRHIYGLSTQRFAFGSLEIAFHAPDFDRFEPDQTRFAELEPGLPSAADIQELAWQALREGLDWATSDVEVPTEDETKWFAVLEAIRRLAPSSTGPVTSVQVSGRRFGASRPSYSLSTHSGKRIRAALTHLKKRHEVEFKLFCGLIRDLDLDKRVALLRDTPTSTTGCSIEIDRDDDDAMELAKEAHYQEALVNVVARSTNKRAWVLVEIEFVQQRGE